MASQEDTVFFGTIRPMYFGIANEQAIERNNLVIATVSKARRVAIEHNGPVIATVNEARRGTIECNGSVIARPQAEAISYPMAVNSVIPLFRSKSRNPVNQILPARQTD